MTIIGDRLQLLTTTFGSTSFLTKFRKPNLNFLSIRIRERFYTELDE